MPALLSRIRTPALALAGLLAAGIAASAADDVCGRNVTSFQQIRDELARDGRLKPAANGGPDFTAYEQAEPLRQWFVTRPGYPEVQAVVCRALVPENGRFFVKVESRCFGPKPTCDRLVAGFQQPAR